MTHNKRDITEYWPVVDRPERQREAVNMQILLNLFKQIWVDQTPQYATPSFIRSFLQTYQISEIMSDIIHGDSLFLYPLTPSHRLPSVTSEELENLNGGSEQSLDLEELIDTDTVFDILIELESYQINAIDETLIMVLDEAFQEVQRKSEIQERCATQLEETQDAVQRAMLFLEMENEKEALAEFKKVSYSELLNPDNALDLISLIEKFQSKHSAFESLKRWFLLECVLHPITHDLISGLVSKRSKLKKSHRFIYLRKLLAK